MPLALFLSLAACGPPLAVTCQLDSTRVVEDPSAVPDGTDFALADALEGMLGTFTGTATYGDGTTSPVTLELSEAGASKQLLYEPPGCGAAYTTHIDMKLTTDDGTLDEYVETDLIVDAADLGAVVATIAIVGGTVEPPETYEDLLTGLAFAITFNGTWTGEVAWSAQEIEFDGEEFEIDDEELLVAEVAF